MRERLTFGLLVSVLLMPTAIFANESSEWEDLLAPSVMFFPETNLDADQEPSLHQQSVDDQILRVDQEILILKAELAYQKGDEISLKNILNQLEKMGVLPLFQMRFEHLKQQPPLIEKKTLPNLDAHLVVSGIQPLPFSTDKEAIIAILLPLTGDYEKVGNQLLESLLEGLEKIDFLGSLVVLDTTLYDSAFEVWQQVKYYEPSFIFGPLRKSLATQWQALNTNIPILYFNEMPFLNGHERALSPSRVQGVGQIIRFLEAHGYQNVLVLTDTHPISQKLEATFHSWWHSMPQLGSYQHQLIEKTVGEAIEDAINIKSSKGRRYWLQHKIETPLVFKPRVRGDIEVVISFVSERNAIQVAPILDFYQLSGISHLWFPTQTPEAPFLKENSASWHHTYALLPPYLSDLIQKNTQQTGLSEKSGLFYALGQMAIEIVNDSTVSDGLELYVETVFGAMTSNSTGQFYLLPMIYSLDPRDTQ